MATYEQIVASEGEYDFNCTPCTKRERLTEAKKFCVECGEYFCSTCLSCHEHFGATKGHTLINCADVSTCRAATIYTKCEIHRDKEEDMVCGEHDVICCRVCIAADHRSCQDIDYLPLAAQTFGQGTEYSELTKDIQCKIQELQKTHREQKTRVVQTKMRKGTLLRCLKVFRTSMINLIENLVNDSEEELEKTSAPALLDMQQDMQNTEGLLSRLNVGLEELTKEKDQLLIYRKALGCKQVLRETGVKQRKVDQEMPLCDTTLKRIAQTVVSSAQDDHFLDFVRIEELDNSTEVPNICRLQDGSFCLAVFQKKKIIRIDKSLKKVDTFEAEGQVWGLCATVRNEIAFTVLSSKKIHFLRFKARPVLKSSFSTTIQCRGIAYRGEKLYVAVGGFQGEGCGQIHVLDLKGQILQEFKTDSEGKLLFNIPRSVVVSTDSIYVTDFEKGVICLDMQGKRQWICKESKFPWGICFAYNECLLIAGMDSHNIVVVSKNGETIGELLDSTDGLTSPKALSFDEQSRRLLVSTSSGRLLKWFDFEEFEK